MTLPSFKRIKIEAYKPGGSLLKKKSEILPIPNTTKTVISIAEIIFWISNEFI